MNDTQAARELVAAVREITALSVPERHQKAIALKTLKMNDVGVSVMGGMTKDEARAFLKKIGYSESKIRRLEASDRTASDPDLEAVAEVVKNNKFMRLDRPLKAIGMKNVNFNTYDPPMPGAMWKMKTRRGKTIVIVNREYANPDSRDIVVGEFVIGYM